MRILEQHLIGLKKSIHEQHKMLKIRPYGHFMVAFETVSCSRLCFVFLIPEQHLFKKAR